MLYNQLEDTELMELMKLDDESAFREIYSRFHDFLFTYAIRLTGGNEEESQDIVQTIFLNLWEKRNTLDISGKMFNYLNQSVRYGFLNQQRNKTNLTTYKTDLLHYINQGRSQTDEYIFEKELVERLRRLAQDIPGKGGDIFLLYYFDNYSHAEIADTLGISEKTVKNLLSKSAKDLRLKIGLSLSMFLLLS
ncbi:RNA polymerase sigma factor [Sphingobacterium kyonggiense]|nr:sigma-70 family RNA polymerase sigma factor [Sphingobacterium mizutaii]